MARRGRKRDGSQEERNGVDGSLRRDASEKMDKGGCIYMLHVCIYELVLHRLGHQPWAPWGPMGCGAHGPMVDMCRAHRGAPQSENQAS